MFASEPGCGAKQPPRPPAARARLVAIVTAIPEEFHAIAPRVSQAERRRIGKGHRGILLRGKIAGVPIILAMTGDGFARAERGVSLLLRESPVSFLVGAGAAGALVPSLRAGEIVVADRVVDANGECPMPDPDLVSRAVALGAKPATFVSVERPMTSSKEKREAAVRFGIPDSSGAVVDMESAAWARAAASRGIPFVLLRAVSDTLEEDLPGFLSSCLSADGAVDRAAVARRLLFHPGALPVLLRMRRRVREGASGLALFLERLLPEMI
jgi:adenosylhomocysteine nucleosidase